MGRARVRREPGESGQEERWPPALAPLLMVAVPMWMDRFYAMTWEERMKVRDEVLAIIGCDEDSESIACFVVGGGKPGRVAAGFNATAKALALGALQPGGVTAFGLHFEVGEVPR